MVSSAVSFVTGQVSELRDSTIRIGVGAPSIAAVSPEGLAQASSRAFLRIPPFPGAHLGDFAKVPCAAACLFGIAERLRELRVGGAFWAAQPPVPEDCVLVRSPLALEQARHVAGDKPIALWDCSRGPADEPKLVTIAGECDPWHLLGKASKLIAPDGDELLLIAALLNVEVYRLDEQGGQIAPLAIDADEQIAREFGNTAFGNPFTGEVMSPLEAIELCGFWRRLIDSNRDISQGLGFAFWKQDHVAPLLWGGAGPVRFIRAEASEASGGAIAVWRARAPAATVAELEQCDSELIEVEDGFLRSRGLGADCVPPLSITVDRLAPHFDPSRPSELELLLENGEFDEPMRARARELRRLVVEAGIGKYGQGRMSLNRPAGDRRHILVPGQVEDDRAVQAGGCGVNSNLELLRRVRAEAPDAYILYKPHPDVLAGHRRGLIPERQCLQYADKIVYEVPISSLIEMVDEVHVNTSLAGFEALMRLKSVTTYGVPFYAGWGLTRDLGPVPSRRTRVRSLDELVAAALILYPRYLDPVTGLPCPAEVVVARLSGGGEDYPGLVVAMRRLQGKFMRRLRSLVQ